MRLRLFLLALPLLGCAAIIGATFDDAGLAPTDAAIEADAPEIFDAEAGSPFETSTPLDPSDVPNLAMWLDATYGVDVVGDASSGYVARWHDRSVFARDALPAGNGTNVPSLVPNALAGRAVLRFVAAQLDMLQSSWMGPGGSDVTIFLVERGYPNSALRFQPDIGNFPYVIFPLDYSGKEAPTFAFLVGDDASAQTSVRMLVDAGTGATLSTATWRSGATAETYDDGVLVEQRLTTNITLPTAPLFIGGGLPLLSSPDTSLPFTDGDIAEVIVYSSALDAQVRIALESYLRTKWAIP